ncbi:MAG: LTA synthase family protein [Gammaproteobacteria bacterium]|nr:LTA synthase family protein [Gammaproteobacteria bacterium]MCW8922939.1 LTA synthase family protein [Gammaproteobacteria bacterium]
MFLQKTFSSEVLSSAWHKTARGLLLFYLTNLFALTLAGFVFKVVFLVYNRTSIGEMPLADAVYALFWGVRFDLASAAIISLVICLGLWPYYRISQRRHDPSAKPQPSNLTKNLFLLALFAQMSMQTSDAMYFVDAGRHVSYEMRDVVADASGLLMTALTQHGLFILACLAIGLMTMVVVIFILRHILSYLGNRPGFTLRFNLQYEVNFFLIIFISIVLVRGGFTGLPQSVITAFKIGDAKQAIVAMNGTYSIIYGVLNSSKEIRRVEVAVPEGVDVKASMRELYPQHPTKKINQGTEVKPYNLIFIFLEGWPAEIMASYGYDLETTPFFDSLVEKSLAPLGVIAGGTRTTEGLFTTLCSQQNPLGGTVAQSSLQNFKYECLPNILKDRGWHTAFFQGTHEDTSGTGAFAQSMGMLDSYAKEHMEAGRYERNFWGAHDPDIYDFALEKIDAMSPPFMVGINTNSTHDIKLPKGVEPHFGKKHGRDKKINILHFADQALEEFFDNIKGKPYYENTIFVILSDHTSGKRSNALSRYLIPGIIYSENLVQAELVNRYASQRDIAPTIFDLLNIEPSTAFAGKSLYGTESDEYFAEYYAAGSINWLSDDLMVETNVGLPDSFKCYSIKHGLLKAQSMECGDRGEHISKQSLAFTAYSQDRLFKGRTKQFYEFLAE